MNDKSILIEMLKDMTVPASRLKLETDDLRWLLNNLGVKNHRHKKFGDAIGRIRHLLKEV